MVRTDRDRRPRDGCRVVQDGRHGITLIVGAHLWDVTVLLAVRQPAGVGQRREERAIGSGGRALTVDGGPLGAALAAAAAAGIVGVRGGGGGGVLGVEVLAAGRRVVHLASTLLAHRDRWLRPVSQLRGGREGLRACTLARHKGVG